jgi:hypothetical protein
MIDSKTKMEAFLRMMNDYHQTIKHRGLPALVLASGRWFQGRASSNDYESAKQWRKKNRATAKECYYNAQSFCLDHEDATYFEGYAVFTDLSQPAEHAWVAMPDGEVVDFTFEAAERIAKRDKLPCDTSDTLYVGVEVPTEFIRETMSKREWFESLAEEFFAS